MNNSLIRQLLIILLNLCVFALHAQCWLQVASHHGNHTMLLDTTGRLWGTGHNPKGQLGIGTTNDVNWPIQVNQDNDWSTVSAGIYHTMALKANGTLWSWGGNYYGQLGNGSSGSLIGDSIPGQVGGNNDWAAIFSGTNQNFAIRNNGTLWSWGDNTEGELGIGSYVGYSSPLQVGLDSTWSALTTGFHHVVGLQTDGTVWTWGYNQSGQLGQGNMISTNAPQLAMSNCMAVAAGSSHTLVIRTDGTLWSTGYNDRGQLGNGNTMRDSIFKQVGTANDWITISANDAYSMGIRSNGTLWTWGVDISAQFLPDNLVPVQVGTDTDWASVVVGIHFALGFRSDGTCWAWGANGYGQLGLGDNNWRSVPTVVPEQCEAPSIVPGHSEGMFSIFPNPAQEQIFVNRLSNATRNWQIIDMWGQSILDGSFTRKRNEIEVSALRPGVYLLRSGSMSHTFIKD